MKSRPRPRKRYRLLCLLLAGIAAAPADAEIVIIANARSGLEQLTRDQAINIFMGRYRKLPDGSSAHPLDLEADSPVRRLFYRQLLDKSLEEIHSYWARLVFSGGTRPPAEVRGVDELIEKVASDPQAIGYAERAHLARSEHAALVRSIKVVLSLPN